MNTICLGLLEVNAFCNVFQLAFVRVVIRHGFQKLFFIQFFLISLKSHTPVCEYSLTFKPQTFSRTRYDSIELSLSFVLAWKKLYVAITVAHKHGTVNS